MWDNLLSKILSGDVKSLARAITLVENEHEGYDAFLQTLPLTNVPVIGITGPPGAGKSTLTDALIGYYTSKGKRVAVLCVDPSSAFNLGALLGDRIRMSQWYNDPSVFIRSLASRGSLGGLHSNIIEITDVLKVAGFDYIIVETVGVGQNEIEIAGLADVTVVAIVPEAGDDIQIMKSGIMEIADVFVVNKADRPGADIFIKHLRSMIAPAFNRTTNEIRIVRTVAIKNEGIEDLYNALQVNIERGNISENKYKLIAEKAYRLISKERMKGLNIAQLQKEIQQEGITEGSFNLYRFLKKYKDHKRSI